MDKTKNKVVGSNIVLFKMMFMDSLLNRLVGSLNIILYEEPKPIHLVILVLLLSRIYACSPGVDAIETGNRLSQPKI